MTADPTIATTQNDPRAQRLLAAQAQLYRDAKAIHQTRVATVFALAAGTVAAALFAPGARTTLGLTGGVLAFAWSLLGGARERRCVKEAVSVQEEFDTYVYQLPWNDFATDRVDPVRIATAASRYRGNRTRDWYPPTAPVVRPLDVLICQRSNLGWGASVHRLYAAILTGALLTLVGAAVALALSTGLLVTEALAAIVVPLLAPVRELLELIRGNRESEQTKRQAEAKIASLWRRAITHQAPVELADCRVVQDRIVSIRQSNAHVPDRIDGWWRSRHETAMRNTAAHMIEEAVRAGVVQKPSK